jgi:hypothetical protein
MISFQKPWLQPLQVVQRTYPVQPSHSRSNLGKNKGQVRVRVRHGG